MSKALDWEGIVAEVHRRKMTMTQLAKMNGLDSSTCRKVKTHTHRKAEAIIAEFIGRKPEDLWPDRYPIRTSRIFDSAKHSALESQIATVRADERVAA